MSTQSQEPWERSEAQCYVALTNDHLHVQPIMDKVRSPQAGAIVLFAGMCPRPATPTTSVI
jgi:molybdopterin synthase catalytic subunit